VHDHRPARCCHYADLQWYTARVVAKVHGHFFAYQHDDGGAVRLKDPSSLIL
jgi:hypothetical protein